MIKQTLKYINGKNERTFIYLPQFKNYIVLNIKKKNDTHN